MHARPCAPSLVPVLLALACTPTSAPPPPPAQGPGQTRVPAPAILATTTPDPAVAAVQLTAVSSSWGSTGVVPADGPSPYWVLVILDLHPEQTITTLRLAELELFDADARSVGRADRELTLHVAPPDATPFSPTDADTPLPSTITPDQPLRLRLRARMEDAFAERVSTAPPLTYRATFHTDSGAIVHLTGPLGSPWPTA